MSSINIAKINLFKIFTITLISIFFSDSIYADSDRDAFIALEKEIKQVSTQHKVYDKRIARKAPDEKPSQDYRFKRDSSNERKGYRFKRGPSNERKGYRFKRGPSNERKGYRFKRGPGNERKGYRFKRGPSNERKGYRFKRNPSNRDYTLKSVDEYVETCREAFDCLARFSPELSRLGRDVDEILSFYTRLSIEAADKNGKFTLNTSRLQNTYVAFRKVLRACAFNKPELIGPHPVTDGVP